MTLQEIQAAYPGSPNAVQFLENAQQYWTIRGQDLLAVLRAIAQDGGIDAVLTALKLATSKSNDGSVPVDGQLAHDAPSGMDPASFLRAAAAEMDTTDFHSYLGAKLGMM